MWDRQEETGASFVLGVMTGAFIGAGVALLFAPKTGQETRDLLGRQYRDLADRVHDATDSLREQGFQRAQEISSQLSDRISSAADRLSSAADRVSSTGATPGSGQYGTDATSGSSPGSIPGTGRVPSSSSGV